MNWRMIDKCLGCWVFSRDVGFVFKFGRNWLNFDVSTSFLVCGSGVVSVRERCPRWCRVRHPCHIRYIFDKVNTVMRLVAIKNEQALLAIYSALGPGIKVVHLPSCYKLISGKALVAMCKYCSLACITIKPTSV